MAVWVREIAGWLLLGLGLYTFYLSYDQFILNKRVIQAVPVMLMGYWIFRGGTHLIKVAVAARACRDVGKLPPRPPAAAKKAPPPRKVLTLGRPATEARASAVPGPDRN